MSSANEGSARNVSIAASSLSEEGRASGVDAISDWGFEIPDEEEESPAISVQPEETKAQWAKARGT